MSIDLASDDIYPFNVSDLEILRGMYRKYVGNKDKEFLEIYDRKFDKVKQIVEKYAS